MTSQGAPSWPKSKARDSTGATEGPKRAAGISISDPHQAPNSDVANRRFSSTTRSPYRANGQDKLRQGVLQAEITFGERSLAWDTNYLYEVPDKVLCGTEYGVYEVVDLEKMQSSFVHLFFT